ncbi:efflux RND transporter periplasmic adaptor subunit [Colwellia psychrerythraea]|uniref:Efflux transporter, RND family, MFP subunit n=1 Tax=Colwellia psychrerythraea TaxID=28229 RepID=A0A099KN65_COLPS|nr:efflux RND transporter periplasmic adaptor subunit [Colwellia psychrerythraea]KGJ91645.1 efflux transporter, RND family, MFP subunit [Colwellia psychrerythraea]
MMKFTLNSSWLAQRPYLIAALITLFLVLWMASGPSTAEQKSALQAKIPSHDEKLVIAKVKVETRLGQEIHKTIELYGRTEPNRVTTLKAEIRGKIVDVLAKRGSKVTKGQVIAKIALNDLPAQLTRSKALLTQREVEYQGALKLNKQGYQGKVQLAQAFAALESVKADIMRLELDIANTIIKAPFTGILNTRYVEVGDYVASGDDIAMIADLDPLIVRAHVTELQVSQLFVGQFAQVSLLNGKQAKGELRYIASVGNDATNTFKIEVAIDNENVQLLAGLSSELTIDLAKMSAIKISPALLALDEQGNIGVKSVKEAVVEFTPIEIIKSASDGIWLTGLGEQADIIVLGQGFVRAGDKVEAIFEQVDDKADDKSVDSAVSADEKIPATTVRQD